MKDGLGTGGGGGMGGVKGSVEGSGVGVVVWGWWCARDAANRNQKFRSNYETRYFLSQIWELAEFGPIPSRLVWMDWSRPITLGLSSCPRSVRARKIFFVIILFCSGAFTPLTIRQNFAVE
jgi:hypothetical protein